jgi:hypothetical protein
MYQIISSVGFAKLCCTSGTACSGGGARYMSEMPVASRKQLVEDVRQLVAELEYLKAALILLGRGTQVEALEGAIEGTRSMLSKIEKNL